MAGFGGGFMERDEVVEYIERNDDDEYDEVSNTYKYLQYKLDYK